MVGYIYKIHNKITGQNYIGQTINIKRRKRTHFGKLRLGTHINPKLQASFNKYGEENFNFDYWEFNINSLDELDSLECKYIDKYNGLTEGYNLIPGGSKPPNHQKVKDEDLVTFLCVLELLGDGYGKTCEQIFGWSNGTASAVKRRIKYPKALEIFDNLNRQEKEQIGKDFIESQHLQELSLKRKMKQGGCEKAYQLTEEDYNFAFAAQDLGFKYTPVAIYLQIKPATVKDWFNGRSRKKEKEKYLKLDKEKKKYYQQLVLETHLEAIGKDKFVNKKEEDVISFLCYDQLYPQNDSKIQKLFNWSEGTCYNIRKENKYPISKAKVKLMDSNMIQYYANKIVEQIGRV